MIRSFRWIAAAALLAVLGAPLAAAQPEFDYVYRSPAVRVLQDYTLRSGETAREVVVIGGNARIEGTVTQQVVVVLGKLELASTAVIEGDLTTVAGTVEIADGARVRGDFFAIGDTDLPAAFSPGGAYVAIGTAGFGSGLRALVPWMTSGLLLGRPIVPWMGWVWAVAGIFFFINLCVNFVFDGPVRSSTATLGATPFSSFMAGLLVLLLAGPVCLLLAVSVIGVAVIPFVLCALVGAAMIGRVGFARWVGTKVFPQADPADRAASLRSFLIGSAIMCVAYVIPIIGFMVWIMAGVLGLGAATLAFNTAYRRENPKPPKKVKTEPPPAPLVPPGTDQYAQPLAAAIVEPAEATPPLEFTPPLSEPESVEPPPARVTYGQGDVAFFPKAVFLERLAGLALDGIIISILAAILELDRHGGPSERAIVFLALVYHVGFWTWKGTTPGGMICQLRVIRTDGKPLQFAESLVRGLTGIVSLAVVGLGFLWILRDPERQGWHDRVAGTYVVKVPRAYPI